MSADQDHLRIPLQLLSAAAENLDPEHETYHPRSPDFGQIRFFRIRGARVMHIVGDSPTAHQCRKLLTEGAIPGWRLHQIIDSHTPFLAIQSQMHRITGSVREYNMLARAGFATVEELAATPDEHLLALPNSGASTLTRIHAFLRWWRAQNSVTSVVLPEAVKIALADAARRLGGHGAVAVCGFPASGKSTAATYLAKILSAPVLDKDSFIPGLEQAVMAELTGDPHDRDSLTYKKIVASHLYDSFLRTGLSVAAHYPVVLDAPFLEVIRQAAETGVTLAQQMHHRSGLTAPAPITTIWIDTPTPDIRGRITARGAERDKPKLADWTTYRNDILDSGIRELAHSAVDIVISN